MPSALQFDIQPTIHPCSDTLLVTISWSSCVLTPTRRCDTQRRLTIGKSPQRPLGARSAILHTTRTRHLGYDSHAYMHELIEKNA